MSDAPTIGDPLAVVRALECRVLEPGLSRPVLESMFAEEFMEVGRSGRVYDRTEILKYLIERKPERIRITELAVRPLSSTVLFATYRSDHPDQAVERRESRRCSLWIWRDGRWQLAYHQGTPEPE